MIKLKDLIKEYISRPTNSSYPTYEVDGDVEKVINTWNDSTNQALKGGTSNLNMTDWDFDRHSEIRSKSDGGFGWSTYQAVDEDPLARKIVHNALRRIGYRVRFDGDGLVFIPIDDE
jgi:hypothetical protein